MPGITNRTVNVGQAVAFTASATDADSAPQTLAFALLAGATTVTLVPPDGHKFRHKFRLAAALLPRQTRPVAAVMVGKEPL